jgi:hypothetical protein
MKNVIISLTTGCRGQDIVSKTFAINKGPFPRKNFQKAELIADVLIRLKNAAMMYFFIKV